jgi:hypothetical protein
VHKGKYRRRISDESNSISFYEETKQDEEYLHYDNYTQNKIQEFRECNANNESIMKRISGGYTALTGVTGITGMRYQNGTTMDLLNYNNS